MKKIFVLFLAPVAEMEKMMAASTPKNAKEGMDEWRKWMKDHKKSIVDEGNALGKTKRITLKGISDAKNDVGGYLIVEAKSHEAAAEMLKDSPHLKMMKGAYIDVLTVVDMENM